MWSGWEGRAYLREWDHTFRQEVEKEGDVLRKYHDDWMLDRIFDNSGLAVLFVQLNVFQTEAKECTVVCRS